jgi:hypothetical protein
MGFHHEFSTRPRVFSLLPFGCLGAGACARCRSFERTFAILALQSLMLYFPAQAAAFNAIRNSRGEVLEWPNRAAC